MALKIYQSRGLKTEDHHDDDKPSVLWHVIKVIFYSLLVIGLILVALYVGYVFYTKQARSKKRFY